ncbi:MULTISPECIES: hypothetical protein [unclassified Hyphomicrobium]|uniref:hypothetical protein n=1 Tax=unclassified Hyphomicrobium TaxID=2619925 RepID=UPI000213DAD7|nr:MULTISPECIES: hypothetical protein [unclassified Hyphomicrobium]CCB65114.1 conserved exported protein of unknown function [Hyphomicrobium sp. MC1]
MSKFSFRYAGLAALAVMCMASASVSAEETPKPADILFERPHIASVAPGTNLVYKFERAPSDPKTLGPGFSDNITLTVESDGAPGKKNVRLQIYSGDRARDPQEITDMDGNPLLVVYLDDAVAHFRLLAGGDGAYLKNMFKKSLAQDAKIAPVKIDYKGQSVDGFRVSLTPYINDPAKARMNGFEGSVFTIALSDKIPGYFAKMVSDYTNNDKKGPSLKETLTLDGVGDVK